MKLTANGHYAVVALLDLAQVSEDQPTTLQTVSQRQSISLPFLEQIFTELRKSGVVISYRGPGGGYKLAKPVDSISVADILEAVGSSVSTTRCKGQENCNQGEKCATHDLWVTLKQQIELFLSTVTLGHLLENVSSTHNVFAKIQNIN